MSKCDSMDKIVEVYFASVTKVDLTYKGKLYHAKPLHVSPQFFDEYTCNPKCAGCCSQLFSLDYLDTDPRPINREYEIKTVDINGIKVPIYSRINKTKKSDTHCMEVDLISGLCGIHGEQPFSCDFETLRFVQYQGYNWLGVRPYGRGWNMLRIDNLRGALCEFPKEKTEASRLEGIRKMVRLKQWTDRFSLETWIPEIIEWASESRYTPLTLGKNND